MAELRKGDFGISRIGKSLLSMNLETPRPHEVINFFTGINAGTSRQFSLKMLAARTIAGTLIFLLGIFSLDPAAPGLGSVALTAWGVSLILGWHTRVLSAAAAGVFGYLAYLGLTAGTIPYSAALLVMAAVVFMIFGPGRLSVDQIFRHLIIKASRHTAKMKRRRRMQAFKGTTMSYRAYS